MKQKRLSFVLALVAAVFGASTPAQARTVYPHIALTDGWHMEVQASNETLTQINDNILTFYSYQVAKSLLTVNITEQDTSYASYNLVFSLAPGQKRTFKLTDATGVNSGWIVADMGWGEILNGRKKRVLQQATLMVHWIFDKTQDRIEAKPGTMLSPRRSWGKVDVFSVHTGVAICNPDFFNSVALTMLLVDDAGRIIAQGTLNIEGGGQTAKFLGQILNIPAGGLIGMLRFQTTAPLFIDVVKF